MHARIGWQGLTKKEYLDEGDYYLVTGVDFEHGHIAFENCHYVTKDRYEQDRHIQIQKDDVLVTKDGTIGKVAIIDTPIDKPATLNSGVFVVRPKDRKQLLPHYLMIVLQSNHFNRFIERIKVGCTVAHLNQEKFFSFEFPLPSEDKQEHIIAVFSRLRAVLDKRQRELFVLDNLIKARFAELCENGYSPMETVEDLCSEIVDCPHTTPKYEGKLKNPAIRTSEIKKGYITWDTMKYVSDEEYEERIVRLRPEVGDIVYGREGTFGNAAILPAGYKFCLGQRVMLLRPDYSKCTSEYLLHAVISDNVYRQALEKNNASTVAHVNVKDVKQFRIPLPTIEKQNQFAEFVNQVEKSKNAMRKALEETQLLFDSLMQEYFG